VRYLAMRDLLGMDGPEMVRGRAEAHRAGPIAAVLEAMHPDGYWAETGAGYKPKYRGTVWSLILLAQLGASLAQDERIGRACAYLQNNALRPEGCFVRSLGAPSSNLDCLQGNLCGALLELGCDDSRLETAFDWMARSVTGEQAEPAGDEATGIRYYNSGNCGPGFACAYNQHSPCAWGAVKIMWARGQLPAIRHTPPIRRAIQEGVNFLLGVDPARADYPPADEKSGIQPSGNWWRFGFPVFYVTDLLQNAEALVSLGYGSDPCLVHALDLIESKQDEHGRWALEYGYAGKTWVNFGSKKKANKWVTLRALRVLQRAGRIKIAGCIS
jgi:hypothetical protein